jgi:hypothetical protein
MQKLLFLVFAALVVAASGFALDTGAIEEADALYEDDQPRAALDVLEAALGTASNGAERAEVLWRMARATLDVGEQEEDKGGAPDPILAIYEQGEQYGVQAVEADPTNHLAYYWQSANIGKWGQLKGILNSLFKAGPMKDLLSESVSRAPEHADSYYVLGQMYEQVPGLISFGNKDYAVSLGRLSIDLHEAEVAAGIEDEMNHDFYVQQAAHLIARDWDRNKRNREQSKKQRNYNGADSELERGFYYEGTVDIPDQSDKEEATMILERMIRLLNAIDDRSDSQNRQLAEANELLTGL